MSNGLSTRPEKDLELGDLGVPPCPHLENQHLGKPLKVCRAAGKGATGLSPALNVWVTDIHALTPCLLTD